MIDSGINDNGFVFIRIETDELNYHWTKEVELVDGDIRSQILDAEINLWTALIRRLTKIYAH